MNHVTQPSGSAFFNQKSINFVISRNTVTDCILIHNSNYFNFAWVFQSYFDKYSYNFDNTFDNTFLK